MPVLCLAETVNQVMPEWKQRNVTASSSWCFSLKQELLSEPEC